METRVKGIYRDGRVELSERPTGVPDDTGVIVTFLEPGAADLRAHGISREDAAELGDRLASFAGEWDSPEMEAYDDYDAVLAERAAR